jgi:hypothetical protein
MPEKTDISVGGLVAMIERGELQLPEMQRRYVWTSTRVRDLLDSLYRGYPSGAILVWETDTAQPTRNMAVSTQQTPFRANKLLLDGQQRLTSLSAVLRGVPVKVRNRKREIDIAFNLDHPEGPPIDVQEIADDADIPILADADNVPDDETDADEQNGDSVIDRLNKRTFAVGFNGLFKRPNWIRVSEVFKGEKSDWQLVKSLVSSPDDPKFTIYTNRLNRLRRVKDYPYVMQVLPREMQYDEVAEIFVRVNSLGAKLRGSDLALAQITARWPNSLADLESFVEECEENWFTLDTGLLVRLIVVFATQQCRFKTVGSIPVDKLKSAWKQAKDGLQFAINFLRTNADIEDESLLSSPFVMIPLAVYGRINDFKIAPDEQRHMLKWLLVANCRGHYSTSSETTLDSDLGVLFRGGSFNDLLGPLHSKFGRLHLEPADFKGRGERNPLFSITYLTLKHAGATDWRTGLGLSLTHQGQLHYIEWHHIFPKSILRKEGYEKAEINEIANMAFISGRANRGISNKQPDEYLAALLRDKGESALRTQGIAPDPSLWKIDAFRTFLERRRETLAAAVNEFITAAVKAGKVTSIQI